MVEIVGGAGGVGGYSETEVGLRDQGWSSGGSFGAVEAAEEAFVSGETAKLVNVAVVLCRGAASMACS